MPRHAIDRWADTALFRFALMFAAFGVFPVLLLGVATTVVGAVKVLAYGRPPELEPQALAVVLLSVGGACGVVGYLRAHAGFKKPRRHNVGATLVLLAAGVLTSIQVAGIVVAAVLGSGIGFLTASHLYLLGALFAAANLVCAFSGIAWMQRLLHRYRESTGVAFDGFPLVLLGVALVLATAAIVTTAML